MHTCTWEVYPSNALFAPKERDPFLPFPTKPLAYVDIFVDDFIGLAQPHSCKKTRKILMHSIDKVFRPLAKDDHEFRQEPISMKKLQKSDCSWTTKQIILGWIIDTMSQTIQLPEHRQQRLAEILDSIPRTQKRISIKK